MATKKGVAEKVTKVAKAVEDAVETATSFVAGKFSNDVVILLKQHVGKPCVPCVKVGDKVELGQLIAEPQGLGANIHSSVNGVVKEITEQAITITSDTDILDVRNMTPESIKADSNDLLACVAEAGVVGMGGAGFPTATKLSTDLKGGYILVNAAECEPFLAHNLHQVLKYPKETIEGIHYCMKIANAKQAMIAIKHKHVEEVGVLLEALKDHPDIHVHLLPDIYPVGEERAIVRECLGKLLDVSELPSAANAHVCNVETVFRVYEAIKLKKPVVSKNLTVRGKLRWGNAPRIMMNVPIGVKVRDVLEWAGGIDGDYGEIIMGGPFMGKPCSLDDPITKTTGGLMVTEPFQDYHGAKVGLLVCACGGNEERLRGLAEKYNMQVVDVEYCKQAKDPKGNGVFKCENPGNCPGQALKCMNIKKAGATEILISNCSDCTNTVMASAPGLGLNVHHQTDHIFRTLGKVLRYLTGSKYVEGTIPKGCTASRNPETKEKEQFITNTSASTAIDVDKPYQFTESLPDGNIVFNVESGSDIKVTWED